MSVHATLLLLSQMLLCAHIPRLPLLLAAKLVGSLAHLGNARTIKDLKRRTRHALDCCVEHKCMPY